jgi:hypothetical protein
MSEEIAHRIRRMETMAEAWARLDTSYNNPTLFINELTLEVQAIPKINDLDLQKQLEYYELLKDNMDEADKVDRKDLFLTFTSIDKMTQALPPREEILWREARKRVAPRDLGATFTDFVENRLDWSIAQEQGLPTESTLLPIDAPRSGSVGGRHSKGEETRKKGNTRPVRKNKKIRRSAHASDNPARIRGSSRTGECAAEPRGSDNSSRSTKSSPKRERTGNSAQSHRLTSKPAQERSQDTLSRKRSQEQDVTARSGGEYKHPKGFDPAGPHAGLRTRTLGVPGLQLQQRWHATRVALTVGTGISCNDGVSSLVQVTNATTASKDGTSAGNDDMTTLAHAPKRTKKSCIDKGRTSPMVKLGRIEHNQNAEEHSLNTDTAHTTTHFHTTRPPDRQRQNERAI